MVKFKEPLKEFHKHQTNEYHLLSAQRANYFLVKFNNSNSVSVDVMLNKHIGKTIENNRKRLVPIVKTILFCARHNLPLRLNRFTIDETNIESNKHRKTKLKKLCDTRWVERHNSIITFKELYVFIVLALEDLQGDANQETSSKATLYLNSVTNSHFLVSLEVSAVCFAFTVQLSIALQSKQQDLSKALSDVLVIKSALESLRSDADNQFKQIFNDVVTMGKSVNIEIKMPRICKRQTQRVNVISENPEIYFKCSTFILLFLVKVKIPAQ